MIKIDYQDIVSNEINKNSKFGTFLYLGKVIL